MSFQSLPVEMSDLVLSFVDEPTITKFVCKEWKNTENSRKRRKKNKSFVSRMAAKGNLNVLKWAKENNCPMDETTCWYAAKNGHLEVLKWLRTINCPWNSLVCTGAAQKGHLEVLIWARANGCPWNDKVSLCAATNGHLNVLQWAIEHGCPWHKNTYQSVFRSGRTDILDWILENNCPVSFADLNYYKNFKTWKNMNIIKNNEIKNISKIYCNDNRIKYNILKKY